MCCLHTKLYLSDIPWLLSEGELASQKAERIERNYFLLRSPRLLCKHFLPLALLSILLACKNFLKFAV
jgi:hypothetical protein